VAGNTRNGYTYLNWHYLEIHHVFATHGIPETIVTDNGSVFTNYEFQQSMDMNGIKHLTTAPYHPESNGLAERAVQTLKIGLKKMTFGNIEDKLAHFLFQYRIIPHTTTGQSPAELLMGRRPQSHLDRSNVADRVSLYTINRRDKRRDVTKELCRDPTQLVTQCGYIISHRIQLGLQKK